MSENVFPRIRVDFLEDIFINVLLKQRLLEFTPSVTATTRGRGDE